MAYYKGMCEFCKYNAPCFHSPFGHCEKYDKPINYVKFENGECIEQGARNDGTRKYGRWAGNPNGTSEKTDKCIAEVQGDIQWYGRQCSKKRGHGRDGLFCKQHANLIDRDKYVSVPKE